MRTRLPAAIAGLAAVGLVLGLTELVALLVDGMPSLVTSVGSLVVPVTPPPVKDWAIEVFGTSDKGALAIGTVVITLAVGALTGLSYLTGPGSVAHVVVGILATALSVWLLAAGWRFHRVSRDARRQHHLVSGLGLVRTAMLLKAILVFSAMVIGCFTFSIAVSLLLLL